MIFEKGKMESLQKSGDGNSKVEPKVMERQEQEGEVDLESEKLHLIEQIESYDNLLQTRIDVATQKLDRFLETNAEILGEYSMLERRADIIRNELVLASSDSKRFLNNLKKVIPDAESAENIQFTEERAAEAWGNLNHIAVGAETLYEQTGTTVESLNLQKARDGVQEVTESESDDEEILNRRLDVYLKVMEHIFGYVGVDSNRMNDFRQLMEDLRSAGDNKSKQDLLDRAKTLLNDDDSYYKDTVDKLERDKDGYFQ